MSEIYNIAASYVYDHLNIYGKSITKDQIVGTNLILFCLLSLFVYTFTIKSGFFFVVWGILSIFTFYLIIIELQVSKNNKPSFLDTNDLDDPNELSRSICGILAFSSGILSLICLVSIVILIITLILGGLTILLSSEVLYAIFCTAMLCTGLLLILNKGNNNE